MSKDDIDAIKKGVKWENPIRVPSGGQSCGVMPRGVRLIHEDLEFDLTINRYRSQLQNRELAMTLFELYISTYN